MKVLIYAKNKTKPLELLQKVVSEVISPNDLNKINSIDTLCQNLKKNAISQNNKTVTILLIADHDELKDLLNIYNRLAETRIILILPDRNPETIKMGHNLYPRYLDFSDSNFTEIGAVLQKLIVKQHEG
jgi:hypothetical protein